VSILSFVYAELDEIIEHLEKLLAKIEAGFESGNIYLRPAEPEKYKFPIIDSVDFWKKDCFYTQSATFRIRTIWLQDDKYQVIFNCLFK